MDLRKGSGWGLEKMDKVELRNLYLCEEHNNHKFQQIFLRPLLSQVLFLLEHTAFLPMCP